MLSYLGRVQANAAFDSQQETIAQHYSKIDLEEFELCQNFQFLTNLQLSLICLMCKVFKCLQSSTN